MLETTTTNKFGGRGNVEVLKKKKLRATGGRAIDYTSRSRLLCGANITVNRAVLIGIAVTLVIGAIIALVFLVILDKKNSSQVRYFEKFSCDEKSPAPIHINSCLKSKCAFDLSTCGMECPFGYAVDESGCEYSCECAVEGVFEGDIFFSEEDLPYLSKIYGYAISQLDFSVYSGSATTGSLWNDAARNGRHQIAFVMSSVTSKARVAIREAIKRFSEQTCVNFVERTSEKRYFRFTSGRGCMSMVGKHIRNGQQVSIGRGCEMPGIVQHELLHLLGFYHEHSRPDRDSYLIVNKDNIIKGRMTNFKKRLKNQVRTLDSEYDLTSIMHYPSNAFSSNSEPTILRRKDDTVIVAQRTAFTKDDLYEVNVLYNCYKEQGAEAAWTKWTQWSSCDETCGLGERSRFRKCVKGEELVSGCKGSRFEKFVCHARPCRRPEGVWSEWEKFTKCGSACEGGFQWRRRKCTPFRECEGVSYQGRSCPREGCAGPNWAMWTAWSTCDNICGGGVMHRQRQCLDDRGKIVFACDLGNESSTKTDKQRCNTRPCGSLADVSISLNWSSCSATCDGIRIRQKMCGQHACMSGEEDLEHCNVNVCNTEGHSMFHSEVRSIINISEMCDPSPTNSWFFGDFNGDGKIDIMCSDGTNQYKLGHASFIGFTLNIAWSGKLVGCEDGEKLVGDFNGDGNDDVLCKNVQTRRLAIKFSTNEGHFNDVYVDGGNFCTGPTSHLVVIYASGDRKADLACHSATKAIEIRVNE